jgi:hypothetical protein
MKASKDPLGLNLATLVDAGVATSEAIFAELEAQVA